MTKRSVSIALFNDTGSYPHVGCKAVSNAHDSQLAYLNVLVRFRHFVNEFEGLYTGDFYDSLKNFFASELVREISVVDAVLVNGEGTIHHGFGLHLLTILAGAQALGKPSYLINSVLQDIPDTYLDVLRKLKDLTVRDLYSYEYLRSKKIHSRLVPDSILMAEFHKGEDSTFEGKIVVTDCVANRTDVQKQLELVLKHYGADATFFPLEGANSYNWQDSLKKLSGARLIVTGRHHGIYLSLMAKKPFIALPSNTWKIEGMLAAIGAQEWLWSNGVDLISMCEKACANTDKFSSIFESDFLKKPQSVFELFTRDFSLSRPLTALKRVEESSVNSEMIAAHIVKSCGISSILDIGSGEGKLVSALVRLGVDAFGVDVSELVVNRANQRLPGRFFYGSVLELPFDNESFYTVVSTDCMEHLSPSDVPRAMAEIHRVAKRFVFLQVATTHDRDGHWHLTVEGRAWWENRCFEAGFRKHPAYYVINNYESLNSDKWQIYILLEKIPSDALAKYPLASLNEERGLHMDMTRDTGERSDAHIIRYQWACNYIKQGDRVLDAACGLGYGGHVVRHLTHAAKVIGIDGSDYAIDYATRAFPCVEGRAEYRLGFLPDALAEFPDGSFEVIISFETLEHVEQPEKLLQEFYRVLTPGGRVIVSVPNDWSDETGEDPNPYHLHVYDWNRLKSGLNTHFIIEDAYAQTASQCKVSDKGGVWARRSRSLKQVPVTESATVDCEWWLMTAMKSPLDCGAQIYEERVFSNLAGSEHPSIRYSEFFDNPWLMHAMINFDCRLKNATALESLANQVMDSMASSLNDYAAAMCVKAYRVCERIYENSDEAEAILSQIQQITSLPCEDPMGLRWKVSLLFVKGKLLQATGCLEMAKEAFIECSRIDIREFGIHLATKTTEAFYLAGRIAYTLGDQEEARIHWLDGIEYGKVLLNVSLGDVLINPAFPNRFNHGDGIREYTVAWDNIARCANGIHLLNIGDHLDFSALDNCHQTEYSDATNELIFTRQTLVERTSWLEQANLLLERANKDLQERTQDLVDTRQTLAERTSLLEQTNKDLQERTQDLVDTRQTLAERTSLLEQTNKDLQERTQDLVDTRQTLAERTSLLEQTNKDLQERMQDLADTRQTLAERTSLLEQTNKDLQERMQDLADTRQTLDEHKSLLEQTNKDLQERTQEVENFVHATLFNRIFIRKKQ